MLKYTINRKETKGDLEPLEVFDYSVTLTDTYESFMADMEGDEEPDETDITLTEDDLGLTFKSPVMNVVTVTCSKYHDLAVGRKVAVTATRELDLTNGESSGKVYFYDEYRIQSVSEDGLTFTIEAPSTYALTGKRAYILDETVVDTYVTYPYEGTSYDDVSPEAKPNAEATPTGEVFVDNTFKEVMYDVETDKRYIYLTFEGEHYFMPDDVAVIAIVTDESGNSGGETVAVAAEYISRDTLRFEVPKDDRRENPTDTSDIDYISEQESEDEEEPSTYYFKNRTTESDLDDLDTIYPYKSVTQDRVTFNGDTFVVIDRAGEDIGPVLYQPYYGDMETAGDDVVTVDGTPYEKVPASFYHYTTDGGELPDYTDSTSDYIAEVVDGDVRHVYIADYIYKKMGDGEYHLLSNKGMYETQEYLYPTEQDAPECPAWLLNMHLFGMNVGADTSMVDIDGELIYRGAFMFLPPYWDSNGQATVSFALIRGRMNIRIPLLNQTALGLNDEAGIEAFVASEREKAINPVREMEKNVYHPCGVKRETSDNVTTDTLEPVKKIKFNLHFRKRDDNWNVKHGDFWNGVEVDTDGIPSLKTEYFVGGDSEADKRSDLLYALGFTNSDVRYQKNKLKKSFLRLSFYDSDDETKQNLLAYSTIFYDGGRAFKRFAQNFDTADMHSEFNDKGKYYIIGTKKEDINSEEWVSYKIDPTDVKYGIRVSREYDNSTDELDDDELENVRLSSQFTVESRNLSTSSSEGFYLYLWKEDYNPPKNVEGCYADTLYMRVDFNHAGYGRVVPFMLPYENGNILSFQEILEKWNPSDEDDDGYSATCAANDIKLFNKYAYIKLNRAYIPSEERYYYFPDPDVYGSDACYDSSSSSLVFNLYEAKIYEGIILKKPTEP